MHKSCALILKIHDAVLQYSRHICRNQIILKGFTAVNSSHFCYHYLAKIHRMTGKDEQMKLVSYSKGESIFCGILAGDGLIEIQAAWVGPSPPRSEDYLPHTASPAGGVFSPTFHVGLHT